MTKVDCPIFCRHLTGCRVAIQLANYYIKNKTTENDIERFEEETAVPEPAEDISEDIPEIAESEI